MKRIHNSDRIKLCKRCGCILDYDDGFGDKGFDLCIDCREHDKREEEKDEYFDISDSAFN